MEKTTSDTRRLAKPRNQSQGRAASNSIKAAITRAKLLDAARQVFSEVGFFQARIDQIILRANVARGTFYVYFQDKEGIFQEVANQTIEELYVEASSSISGDLLTRLQRGNEGYLRAFERHWKIMKALLEVAVSNSRFAAIYQGMRQRFVVRLQRHIARHMATGEYRNLDIPVTAKALACMVEWYAFTYFVFQERSEDQQREFANASRILADIWLSGSKSAPVPAANSKRASPRRPAAAKKRRKDRELSVNSGGNS
ncbi:MAG: TetR/AcrR family transcriptional regulator [Reyranellaceae bacterium]